MHLNLTGNARDRDPRVKCVWFPSSRCTNLLKHLILFWSVSPLLHFSLFVATRFSWFYVLGLSCTLSSSSYSQFKTWPMVAYYNGWEDRGFCFCFHRLLGSDKPLGNMGLGSVYPGEDLSHVLVNWWPRKAFDLILQNHGAHKLKELSAQHFMNENRFICSTAFLEECHKHNPKAEYYFQVWFQLGGGLCGCWVSMGTTLGTSVTEETNSHLKVGVIINCI